MKANTLLLIGIACLFISQTAFAEPCNCDAAFKWATKAFEENDAGFQYIIDQKGREAYDMHTITFQKKVSKITNPDSCVKAMRQWAKFFRVGHFGFIVNQTASKARKSVQTNKAPDSANTSNHANKNLPSGSAYDSTTVYLRIPTFDSHYKKAIDSLLNTNANLIRSKKNLIIDIRDNGGGDDQSYAEIIPFL